MGRRRRLRAARSAVDAALADAAAYKAEGELKDNQAERKVVADRIKKRGAFIKEVAGFVETAVLPKLKPAREIAGMAKDWRGGSSSAASSTRS